MILRPLDAPEPAWKAGTGEPVPSWVGGAGSAAVAEPAPKLNVPAAAPKEGVPPKPTLVCFVNAPPAAGDALPKRFVPPALLPNIPPAAGPAPPNADCGEPGTAEFPNMPAPPKLGAGAPMAGALPNMPPAGAPKAELPKGVGVAAPNFMAGAGLDEGGAWNIPPEAGAAALEPNTNVLLPLAGTPNENGAAPGAPNAGADDVDGVLPPKRPLPAKRLLAPNTGPAAGAPKSEVLEEPKAGAGAVFA